MTIGRDAAGTRPRAGSSDYSSIRTPLRGRLYTTLQALRGRPLARFVRELREWEQLTPAEFGQLHEQRLAWILAHAHAHVPWYRSGSRGRGSADAPLDAWPVLERDTVREHQQDLLAQPLPGRVVRHRTSGSTGAALRIVMTPEADLWGWAHRYRALLWHGVPIGARTLRLSHDKRPARDLVLGHKTVPSLDTAEEVERALRFLRHDRTQLVTGPPSALFRFARRLKGLGLEAPAVSVARAGGEQLFPFQRREIQSHLGGRIVDSYGCTEIGALAGECSAGSMHIYADHVHLEIFQGDSPAPPGEFGDIVATGLHNPAMPLVRYRVGDRGRLSPERCRCGLPHPVLEDLQARSADSFQTAEGGFRHGSALCAGLGDFFSEPFADGIRQLQFVQLDSKTWRVLVEADTLRAPEDPVRASVRDRLTGVVRQAFGPACVVDIEVVDAIPRQHGKLAYYRLAR